MSGQVGITSLKYVHSGVCEHVKKIKTTNNKESNTDVDKVRVVHNPACIPDKHEDGTGNDYAEYLGNTVEKQVAMLDGYVQDVEGSDDYENIQLIL